MTDTWCNCSPTSAFKYHLVSNLAIPDSAPLFAFENGVGTWSPMKCGWFLACCSEIWEWEGLSLVKGHSFRIGGTMHLIFLGVDPWIVMVQGSSQSFLSYWCKCEEILLLFISF